MTECIFCKIVEGELPAEIIFESDSVVAFKDLNPVAPFHCLIIPRKHIATINDIAPDDQNVVGELSVAAASIAAQQGFANDGYRTVMNCGDDGGQTVYHIHLHLLAGRKLTWPPG